MKLKVLFFKTVYSSSAC